MSQTVTKNTYSAANFRSRSGEARKARASEREGQSQEKNEHLRRLLKQYRDSIVAGLPDPARIEELAGKGHTSVLVHYCHPPLKTEAEIDGETRTVPLYTADLTHFGGYKGTEGEAADPTDHSVGGYPRVALVQGFRSLMSNGRMGKADPKTLPDALTVVDLLNKWALEQVSDPEDALCFRVLYRSKEKIDGRLVPANRLEIHMIWDIDSWEQWIHKSEEKRAQYRAARREQHDGGDDGTKTMDEYMEEQERARAAKRDPESAAKRDQARRERSSQASERRPARR